MSAPKIDIDSLKAKANLFRKEILETVSRAGSGHPGGSLSSVEIMISLYEYKMNHRPSEPQWEDRDRLIVSKGHCSPVVYVTLANYGYFPKEDLKTFRKFGSRLQGHVHTKVSGVEFNTDLGHGLSVANGIGLGAKLLKKSLKAYCLLGDGEIQEGSVWEAAMTASHYKIDNVCAIVDYNKVQENGPVEKIKNLEPLAKKWSSFGWHVIEVDGHDFKQLFKALDEFDTIKGKPTVIIAHTEKGKGVSFMEGQSSWHGKAPNADQLQAALADLDKRKRIKEKMGAGIATREGFGQEMVLLGKENQKIVMVSADLEDATRAEYFKKAFPERFFTVGIAEQDMVGTAAGLSLLGFIPFINSFAVFLTNRAYDMIRMDICYNKCNVKIVCSHAGVTVGEDGASAQCLEDFALMRVLPNLQVVCPVDTIETVKATRAMAAHVGPVYLRTSRAAFPVLTDEKTPFEIGKANILREGRDVTLIGCGLMVSESLQAAEILEKEGVSARVINMHTIKPIDKNAIISAAKETGAIVTAEEHQANGGLGSAVAEVLVENYPVPMAMVAVRDTFGESGTPEELLRHYHLKGSDIAEAAKKVISRKK